MSRIGLPLLLVILVVGSSALRAADEEIFSGPQVGEQLVSFPVRGVLGESAGKEFDLIARADGKPVVIIFVHEVTRPSVGLTRLVMNYAARRDGLTAGVVFLTEDATETENWMKRASHALPKGVVVGISPDGKEGPGAYGLNRNVTLTVLVGKANKTTANMALVQPSIQADVPRIVKAVVDVLGGGDVPTLAELGARRYMRTDGKRSPREAGLAAELAGKVRALIRKDASADDVQKATDEIEAYFEKHEEARKQVGEIAHRIVRSGKLANYGTLAAQQQLKKWAQKYGPGDDSK